MTRKSTQSVARRIITRGVLDMATLQWDRSQEQSYLHEGPVAEAEAAPDKVKAAIDEALGKHFKKVDDILVKHTEDIKVFGSIQDSTKEEIAKLNTSGQKTMTEFLEYKEKQNAIILDLSQKLAARSSPNGGGNLVKSIGQQFAESPELIEFAPTGRMNVKAQSKPFKLKTITGGPVSGGPGITPEYLQTPVIPNFQNLTVRDLLSIGTTESDLIYWFQENVFTNNAAVVSEGALKPQSDITYTRNNVPVTTIAHWMKASKQVLSDFKLLMSLIDTRLNFGLKLVEEHEILYGDGTGDHLHGLVPQATAYTGVGAKANDTHIDVIAHAMLQVRQAFYPATGVVMSPQDWWSTMLTKDSQHRYLFASPIGGLTPMMIWGLPVVASDSFHAGDFMVGSFKLAATLFDREQAQILVSTEDQDNFVRNMVTILCEERVALAVTRPASFVYGAFPSGTST